MSPRHVVVVPSTLVLLPEYAGLEDPLPELRAATRAAVAWLVERHPAEVSVLAGGPRADNVSRGVAASAGERVGRQLLVDAGFGGQVVAGAAGLLVVANGSARRSEKAPGHLDERSSAFDARIEQALRTGVPELLRDLDEIVGRELWAHDVTALRELGRLVDGPVTAVLDLADDPFGVQYWVARWTCGS